MSTNQWMPALTAEDLPIIRIVNLILVGAINKGATEISVVPDEEGVVVVYLIDGELLWELAPPKQHHAGVVARFRALSQLDSAQQEGRFPFKFGGRNRIIHLTIEPTPFGEKVTIRPD